MGESEAPLPKEVKTMVDKRLNISREAELLQSFVRVNVDESNGNSEVENRLETQLEKQKAEAALEKLEEEKIKRQQTEIIRSQVDDEVKKKGKRRRRRNIGCKREELYCDKDRAAAVNLGSRDIKQSLKMKRKQDRSKALMIPEEAEPSTFLAWGNYEMGKGDLKIALDFITKALELNPTEKNALVARSKCYILLGQPAKALDDAEMALNIDKNFLKAIYQKAESLYYLGNFEYSLMYFHRGLHIRPDHEQFKLGVHKSQKAIENAIGGPSLFGTGRESKQTSEQPTNRSGTSNSTSSKRVTPISRARSSKGSRLLRELGADKDYLDNLLMNPNIKCKFKEDDDTIMKNVQETVDYLNARQEFWRQQLPPNLR
ncbi:outer dynein arm-docking complex subunit 4 [Coccinella septempunctata]|uniref:outer dynein arm-docking complex subunit 4 n=1 Tax=Coccinella septempunctata TaxID=41139 RepID=UPI001D06E8A4|nr:outer dynein arm-docking complex subunit 4 [Coccinella septempunctata]